MLFGEPEGRGCFEDLGTDFTIILRYLKETGCGGMDWIHLTEETNSGWLFCTW
jgi:hypothetical protein